MTWCNRSSSSSSDVEIRGIELITPNNVPIPRRTTNDDATVNVTAHHHNKSPEIRTITCPSCGHDIQFQDQGGIQDLPGLPAGVKFDPNDQEILEHLEAKVQCDVRKLHPLIDEFIPSLEGENGICYTHPEKLPGVSNDGQVRHFFHRPSKAYTTGTRKRRKVQTEEEGSETRWHKTGKTRAINVGGAVKGFKKILVLYTNYGRQKKPEKTNWVMHQYHLGSNEEERDGELVVSKVFYQTQPRQCGSSIMKYPYEDRVILNTHHHHRSALNNNNNSNSSEIVAALAKNNGGLNSNVDYYNPASFISYDHSPQLIPNMVVEGDTSSFIRLAMDNANKAARI